MTALDPPNPRWDRDFTVRCLWDLIQHHEQWRQLGRLYAAHVPSFERCKVVGEAVEYGRRIGLDIEGDRKRGYRLVGLAKVQRLYLSKPGPVQDEGPRPT